ncbi:MAG TPA: HlyD family secretion protein [Rhodospirillales bacterium]|nr:HlyD family secretion protein [Rhodospirillales bacterium]
MPANEAPPAVVPAAPEPAIAAPAPPRRRLRIRGRLLLAALAVAALWGLYVLSLQFFAYTSDAFVAADVLMVAPQVGGTIAAVHIRDNQPVRQGAPLIDIDPTPYALQAQLRAAELAKAEADEQSAVRDVARAEAERATKLASLGLARRTERRYAELVGQGAASQLVFDEAKTKLSEAEMAVRAADAVVDAARQAVDAQKAAIGVAKRALDLARWDLAQTRLTAPVDGHINNLWLRVGDYARAGEPRLGIVASDQWYVIALYKEEAIRHLVEGGRVWIHLDLYPWQLFRGQIQGVARGIGRELGQTTILPQIEPTTGWIRFQRRFPVRIRLDDVPADVRLHVGANARTLAVYGW